MVNKSLGLIEVVGLAAAIEAADAAVKAANVQLLGYELTKGGGLVLVKICGDVGAVTAGVQAGSSAASKVSKVWSTHVIPRPHQQLSCIIGQEQTLGEKEQPPKIVLSQVIEEKQEMIKEASIQSELPTNAEEEVEVQIEEEQDAPIEQELETPTSELNHENSEWDDPIKRGTKEKKAEDICNLCNDPACHRKKGDPKITCIYYGKDN